MCTAASTEDTVTFIQYARQIHGEIPDADRAQLSAPRRWWAAGIINPLCKVWPALQVIARHEQHPGFPLLLLGVRETLGPYLANDVVWQWIRSGQLASVLAGLLLTLALYGMGVRLLGGAAAFVGCLIVTVMPAFLIARVDALSDVVALSMLVLSGWFASRLLEAGTARDALGCGSAGGLAYLVRPEAIQIAVLTAVFLVFRLARGRDRRSNVICLCALGLPLLLCCGSYMFLRGSLLTKQARVFTADANQPVHDAASVVLAPRTAAASSFAGMDLAVFGASDPAAAKSEADASADTPRRIGRFRSALQGLPRPLLLVLTGIWRFFQRWAECAGAIGLAAVLLGLFVRRQDLLSRPAHRLIATAVLGNLIVLPGVLYYKKGYIDWRHLLPVVALTACWVWPGLLAACAWAIERTPNQLRSRLSPALFAAVVLGMALSTAVVSPLSSPLHEERHGYRLAGEYLRDHAAPGEHLIDPESLPSFFADRDAERCWDYAHPALTDAYLDQMLAAFQPARYFVASNRYLRDHGRPDGMPSTTRRFSIVPEVEFSTALNSPGKSFVRIYRIARIQP
jgi:hypothetical protein